MTNATSRGVPERSTRRTGTRNSRTPTQDSANRGPFSWADAITHGRAGRREEAAALLADGEEALGLVAEGLTNTQVAERLFLSPRTVDTHVANLLAKAGVPSRIQLRTWAGESR